jgi:hypothetical protein
MAYYAYPTVQNIIDGVSQDVRNQLSSSVPGTQQSILIDYTNRVHKHILRFSNWKFLNTPDTYFLTAQGQTRYWLGDGSQVPAGAVDTGLHLTDMARIEKDSFLDMSNDKQLHWLNAQPVGPQLNDRTGGGRVGLPAVWTQDPNNPYLVSIYPPPDNQNTDKPQPEVPFSTVGAGGALAGRTYYIFTTIVDSAGNESSSSSTGRQQFVPANNLVTVVSPLLTYSVSGTGVLYNQFNVYIGLSSNASSCTKQNASPIAMGSNWTEPTTGLTTTGASVPTTNNLTPFNAYLIKFRYYRNRKDLSQVSDYLQVPMDYKDIVINGVNTHAWKLLGKKEDMMLAFQAYKAGLTEMIWDKNQFPEGVAFIRPDNGSYVNQQLMNMWPSFF